MENNALLLEYLLIIRQEDTFCDTAEAFLKFLSVDSSLDIDEAKKTIEVKLDKKTIKVSFTLDTGLVNLKNERYFKLALNCDKAKIAEFDAFSAKLEKIFLKLAPEISINMLWNDISRQYAIEGYALINEVENLLRRLIANFMLVNVGYDWHKSHIPEAVGNRNGAQKSNYSDYLHQTYLSDLKTILFEGQREMEFRNIGDIQRLVQGHIKKGSKHIDIAELEGIVATSLWEKYFASGTDYKKEHLEGDLDTLNELRNQIAHNRHVSREVLGKIQSISRKIIKALKLELARLPETVLSKEDQIFQTNNADNLLLSNNQSANIHIIEQLVEGWYVQQNPVGSLTRYNRAMVPTEIILEGGKRVGVHVKVQMLSTLSRSQWFLSIRDFVSEVAAFEHQLEEIHLVVVLRDYLKLAHFPVAKILNTNLGLETSNVKVIVGYIDQGVFTKIPNS